MATERIIAVVGATGAQGGSVIRAILADDGGFSARALTRDPNSAKAKELQDRGVEVVQADLDDLDSLERAFQGAYGAFAVTPFWAHFSADKELVQATNQATAAKRARLQHVVWSTLEDTRKWVSLSDERMPTLQGKYKVPHFDAKGEADNVFRSLGVPTTFLVTSFYWENFIYFGMGPKKAPDGTLTLTLPMGNKKLAAIAVDDIGKVAYAIFKRPDLIGKTVGIAGGHLSGAEMATALSQALGRVVRYNAVPPATYRSFGFPGADDLGNMFQFDQEFEQVALAARPIEGTRALNPSLQTFEQWLAANKDRIPLE